MAARISILNALDDPDLFAPHFKGKSWAAWRGLLAALFALPAPECHLEAFTAATGRSTWPTTPFSEAALIVGRRGGKSRVLALIAVYLAIFRDYTIHLAPGEVATIAVLAANRSQARSIFRFISGLLRAVPAFEGFVVDENTEQITLANRVSIEISTASFRTTRGYSFAAVLCDETAFWRSDETSANPDVEILRALRPGMANIPGSILLMASSPYAKRGELYNTFRRHFGKDDARVLVWKADTQTMNPRVDPKIIAEAYESDPEAARAEYGAEFRDDLADYITREAIEAVTMFGRNELPFTAGVQYSAFCDPSGGLSDSMTLAVAHLQDGQICVLDAILEIRPPFDPEVAVAECSDVLKRFGISRVIGDKYAGEWPRARFAGHGITFEQSAKPKSDIYHDLLPLINAHRIELLDHARLTAQLAGLERRTARSGRDSIDHSPGGHDDLANAVAGVIVNLDLDRRPALVRQSDMAGSANQALPIPSIVNNLIATLAVSPDDGTYAVVYSGSTPHYGPCSLQIIDIDTAPQHGGLFRQTGDRLRELATNMNVRTSPAFFVPEELLPHAEFHSGVYTHAIPRELDAEQLMLPAAALISAGKVKLCTPADEKSRHLPFGGALDFRAGEDVETPLRRAMILTVAMNLLDRWGHEAA